MPTQNPGTARKRMLKKRATLSLTLFGRSALTIATGIPAIHDSGAATTPIAATRGGRDCARARHTSARAIGHPSTGGAPASDAARYLATYHLAPVPVLVAPDRVPAGWILAVYGPLFVVLKQQQSDDGEALDAFRLKDEAVTRESHLNVR